MAHKMRQVMVRMPQAAFDALTDIGEEMLAEDRVGNRHLLTHDDRLSRSALVRHLLAGTDHRLANHLREDQS